MTWLKFDIIVPIMDLHVYMKGIYFANWSHWMEGFRGKERKRGFYSYTVIGWSKKVEDGKEFTLLVLGSLLQSTQMWVDWRRRESLNVLLF